MGLDQRAYRDALGCFATGVTVVTTWSAAGRPVGITVNSFNSVSLDPPLVLFCLGRASACLEDLLACGRFAVNVLRDDQTALSRRFASGATDKWRGIDYRVEDGGCPILPEALARFECEVETTYEGGDHTIVVGRVLRFGHAAEGEPLLFVRGRYVAPGDGA